LSTRPWSEYSDKVIGIEPSLDMIKQAMKNTYNQNVRYQNAYGNNTGLNDNSVDLVSMSSALHWMEPESTIAELNRIMKKNAVICVYGHYYPFYSDSFELTKAHEVWRKNLDHLEYKTEKQKADKYNVSDTFILLSEMLSYSRKIYIHSHKSWNKENILGFMNSHAGVKFLADKGYNEKDLKFNYFNEILEQELIKKEVFNVYFTYSIFLGYK